MVCRGNFEKLADNGAHKLITSGPGSLSLPIPPVVIAIFSFTMSDALKAEGNKAFTAKDYPTAMYAATPLYSGDDANESQVRNSPRLLPSILRTISSSQTVPPSTAPRPSTKKLWRMPRSRSASSRTGQRATSARELPTVACRIGVSERFHSNFLT
jgi:hypothetical protein